MSWLARSPERRGAPILRRAVGQRIVSTAVPPRRPLVVTFGARPRHGPPAASVAAVAIIAGCRRRLWRRRLRARLRHPYLLRSFERRFLTHGGVSPLPPPVPVPPSAAVCLGAGSGVTGLDRVDVHARTRCRFGATHLRAATVGFGRQSARVVPTDSAVGRDVAPTDSARSVSQWQLVVT